MALPRIENGQGFITGPLKALGYDPNPLGMCNGITGSYIQDDVLGKRSDFNKRIDIIRDRKNLIEDLKKQPLADELKEVPPFFQAIKSYQRPNLFAHSNGLQLHPHDFESVSQIAGSYQIKEKGGLTRVYLDEVIYTPVEWCGYLQKLRDLFQQIKRETKETSFDLSTCIFLEFDDTGHAMGLSYDIKNDTWVIADPNHLPAYPIRSAEKSEEVLLSANAEEWKLQPEKAYQNVILIKILQLFYEKYFTTNYISGFIQIYTAQAHPELSLIKTIFQKFKSSKSSYCASLDKILTRRAKKNCGIVHFIAKADDIKKMQDISEAKGEINLYGGGVPAIFSASSYGSTNIIEYLCKPEFKIDLNQLTDEGFTAAFTAAQHNRPEVLEILGNAGANLDKACKKGFTPLHKAAQDGLIPALKFLLKPEYKINLNCANDDGATPLFLAAKNNHVEALMLLVMAGADLTQTKKEGWSPLHIASQEGSIDALKFLLKPEFKMNLDQNTEDGYTAVYIAAGNNQADIIKVLAHSGANIHKANNEGWTPLHIAAQNGYSKVLSCILQLDSKTDLNATIPSGVTAAFIAAQNNHAEFLKKLAENGADLNLSREDGINALHMAAGRGHKESIKVLLEYKCNILQESHEGHTAFYYAVDENYFEAAEQLLKDLDLKKLNTEDWELLKQHRDKFPLLNYKISSYLRLLGFFVPESPHYIDSVASFIAACNPEEHFLRRRFF